MKLTGQVVTVCFEICATALDQAEVYAWSELMQVLLEAELECQVAFNISRHETCHWDLTVK